jgi:hypothetical protein
MKDHGPKACDLALRCSGVLTQAAQVWWVRRVNGARSALLKTRIYRRTLGKANKADTLEQCSIEETA